MYWYVTTSLKKVCNNLNQPDRVLHQLVWRALSCTAVSLPLRRALLHGGERVEAARRVQAVRLARGRG